MFNRKALKKEAKDIAFNNVWYLLWPQLLITLINYVLALTGIGTICNLFIIPLLQVAYIVYVRGIIKGEQKNFWELIKEKFPFTLTLFLVNLLTSLFIVVGAVLLIIPGIIVALGLSYVYFVLADEPKLKTMDAIEKSWNLMKGHKTEYLVLNLSFILWYLLSIITFGIALIWVIPYVTVTQELYYQYLKTGKQYITAEVSEVKEPKEDTEPKE